MRCIPVGQEGGGEGASLPSKLAQDTQGTPQLFIAGGLFSFEGVFLLPGFSRRGVEPANTQPLAWRAPGPSLGLASPGLMCYQQVFEFKGILISQLPLKLPAVSVLNMLSPSIFFSKVSIAYNFKKKKKKCNPLFFPSILIKTLERFRPICTKLIEKLGNWVFFSQ